MKYPFISDIPKPEEHFKAGDYYMRHKDYEKARRCYKEGYEQAQNNREEAILERNRDRYMSAYDD